MKRTLIMLYRARYGEEEEMVKSVAAAVSPARRSRRRSLRKRAAGQRPLALELHAMKGRIVVIAAPRENGGAGASASPARLEGKLDAWLAAEQAASFAGMHYSFYASVEGELPALAEAVHAAMGAWGRPRGPRLCCLSHCFFHFSRPCP